MADEELLDYADEEVDEDIDFVKNNDKESQDENTITETTDKSLFKKSDTIKSSTTSSRLSKKSSKGKGKRPEWNRYNFHLNDKQRQKLMELPSIPKTVRLENKAILKRRSRSAKTDSSAKLPEKTTKKILKSIIKKRSPSTSRSVSVLSRAKSVSRLDTDEESQRHSSKKSSVTINTRSESTTDNYSDKEFKTIKSSKGNLPRRKMKFTSIRNTKRRNSDDIDEQINEINNGFDRMQVSKPYDRLLRSMRYNL